MKNCFYCEQCGGELEILPNGIGQCIYNPKHRQKIPTENKGKYQRAQILRRDNKDFEGAIKIYEQILLENPEESAAHWELVLSIYGIEYVKDYNGEYIPTCHRIMKDSILENGDYFKALEYAQSEEERKKYKIQAELIDRYQKKIKQIAANEEPYDVFISFKAKDDYNYSTQDSQAADKLYNYLTKELKLRTFFSPVSLAGKTGEFEPYIYAALHSAKVMVIVASCPEYIDAAWVKNEWSRFIRMIPIAEEKGERKAVTIAMIGDMVPEKLPTELSGYQATSMEGLGVLEKFCHNIDHYIGEDKLERQKKEEDFVTLTQDLMQIEIENFMKLADNFRMSGNFEDAAGCYTKALERDPENGKAYWGRLLSAKQVKDSSSQMEALFSDIEKEGDYQNAVKFSDPKINQYYQETLQMCCYEYEKKTGQENYDKTYEELNRYFWNGLRPEKGVSDETAAAMKDLQEKNQQKNIVVGENYKVSKKVGRNIALYLILIVLMPLLYPMYHGKQEEAKIMFIILGILFICTFIMLVMIYWEDVSISILTGSGLCLVGASMLMAPLMLMFEIGTENDQWFIRSIRGPIYPGTLIWNVCGFIFIVSILYLIIRRKRIFSGKQKLKICEQNRADSEKNLYHCLQKDLERLNDETKNIRSCGKEIKRKDRLNLEDYRK